MEGGHLIKIGSQKGFIGGVYVAAMVISVSILGSLISLSANTAKKIGVTQTYVNNDNVADRLAAYLITHAARDIDADNILELPPAWYALDRALPGEGEPTWNYQNTPGYLPNTPEVASIRATLGLDAARNPFRVCSSDIGTQGSVGRTPGLVDITDMTNVMRQPIFAIISTGNNATLQTNCQYAYVNRPLGDDRVKVITYAELIDNQYSNRLTLFRDNPPSCTATQSLEFVETVSETGDPSLGWICRDNYMPLATQPLPNCTGAERLVVNANRLFECRRIERVAYLVPETVSLNQLAAPICRRGYQINSASTYIQGGQTALTFNCARLASYGDEVGGASENLNVGVPDTSCGMTAPADKFVGMYRGRDGIMRCTGMPLTMLAGSGCSATNRIVYDRGQILCFDSAYSLLNRHSLCAANQYPEYETITGTMTCRDGSSSIARNWIVPYSDVNPIGNCTVGGIVLGDANRFYCAHPDDFLKMITPDSSCGANEYLTWSTITHKFLCIQ